MMSSCSSEKLCTSSTATAAGTPRSGAASAARADSRASAGRSALPDAARLGAAGRCPVRGAAVGRWRHGDGHLTVTGGPAVRRRVPVEPGQAQVVGGDRAHLGAEPGDRRGHRRADQVPRGRHARGHHGGHAGVPGGAAADRRDPAGARPGARRSAAPSRLRRSSRTAFSPLRTAPSIVSGHPVSVQAPARTRPARGGGGRGPQPPHPGHLAHRGPALPGDEAIDDPRLRRRGEQLGQRGQELLAQPGGRDVGVGVRRRQRDRQVLAFAQARRPGPVEHPLDRRVHRRGERQPGHPPVVDHVHVDDGRGGDLQPLCWPGGATPLEPPDGLGPRSFVTGPGARARPC